MAEQELSNVKGCEPVNDFHIISAVTDLESVFSSLHVIGNMFFGNCGSGEDDMTREASLLPVNVYLIFLGGR